VNFSIAGDAFLAALGNRELEMNVHAFEAAVRVETSLHPQEGATILSVIHVSADMDTTNQRLDR
jgi:hypothetical protein